MALRASSSAPLVPRDISHLLASLATLGCNPGEAALRDLERCTLRMLRRMAGGGRHAKQALGARQAASGGADGEAVGGSSGGQAAEPGASAAPDPGVQPKGFPPGELCWILWALAKLGHPPRELLRAVDEVWGRSPVQLYTLHPEDVGRVLWVLARLEHRSGGGMCG